jgi:hypothetical protein
METDFCVQTGEGNKASPGITIAPNRAMRNDVSVPQNGVVSRRKHEKIFSYIKKKKMGVLVRGTVQDPLSRVTFTQPRSGHL